MFLLEDANVEIIDVEKHLLETQLFAKSSYNKIIIEGMNTFYDALLSESTEHLITIQENALTDFITKIIEHIKALIEKIKKWITGATDTVGKKAEEKSANIRKHVSGLLAAGKTVTLTFHKKYAKDLNGMNEYPQVVSHGMGSIKVDDGLAIFGQYDYQGPHSLVDGQNKEWREKVDKYIKETDAKIADYEKLIEESNSELDNENFIRVQVDLNKQCEETMLKFTDNYGEIKRTINEGSTRVLTALSNINKYLSGELNRFGAGTNHPDFNAAISRGVKLINTEFMYATGEARKFTSIYSRLLFGIEILKDDGEAD